MLPSIFITAILFASTAICDDESYFMQPLTATGKADYSSNPVYQTNKLMKISWATTMPVYSIFLSQMDLDSGNANLGKAIYSKQSQPTLYSGLTDPALPKGIQSPSKYLYKNWTVNTQDFNLQDSPVFILALAVNDQLDGVVLSRTFNVSSSEPLAFASGKADSSNTDDGDQDTTVMLTVTQTRSVTNASISMTLTGDVPGSNYTTTDTSWSYSTTPEPTKVPFTYSAPHTSTSTTGIAIPTISKGTGANLCSYRVMLRILSASFVVSILLL